MAHLLDDEYLKPFEPAIRGRAEAGRRRLAAVYRPTPKNAPVAQLFDGFGFVPLDNAAPVRTYRKELAPGA